MVRRPAHDSQNPAGNSLTDPILSAVQEFEVHLEPDRAHSMRLFLTQQGARVSSASGLVPKPLREFIQSQKSFASTEKELIEFLDRNGDAFPLHVHTQGGPVRMLWDPERTWGARTELDLVAGRVRVQKVLSDKNQADETIRRFVRVGDRLVGDLEKGRLVPLTDASGWYVANLLQETQNGPAVSVPGQLVYEPDPDAEYAPPPLKPAPAFFSEASEVFEISTAFFNDKKIGYPKDQRAGYLKDLVFRMDSMPVPAQEGELSFRVTLSRAEGAVMSLKGACFWDGQWFDFGSNFFKYFEHLRSLRSPALRKRTIQRRLAQAAFELLSETDASGAEKVIELEVARLALTDRPALWEAEEYLRRFFKLFVSHEVENLLVRREGWFQAPLDARRLGALFMEVQRLFGGDLVDWLERQEKEVPLNELFTQLRPLHAALEAKGVQLCYRDRPVQKARVRVRIGARPSGGMEWFDVHPEISWEGRALSEAEWRSIVENRGVREDGADLWVLEEASLKKLEVLRELLRQPRRRQEEASPVRVDRLQILDWVHLRRFGVEVELDAESERLVRRLMRFEKIESRPLPQRFRGQLRDYQKEGYDWLAFLYEHGLGGCLADDMGLGKTVQAIAFLGGLRERKIAPRRAASAALPHLVVVPSTLVFNWKQEFKNFYPDLDVREYAGSGAAPLSAVEGAEVLITTYDLMRREEKFFHSRHFHTVIFDEAQFMKNLSAKRTTSARRLRCDFALTLTGTPLENHLGEYYSILDLSLPGILGSYEEFRRWGFSDPLDRLKKRAAPFVLRRTKDKTLKELPPKSESEVYLRMSPRQKALYQTVVAQVKRDIDKAFEQKPAAQASLSALTAILRLRQVCVSPKILDPRIHERSPKIEFMLSKLREVVEEDHSALVFSQFTSFLDILEDEIKKEGLDYFRMDGSTPKAKRKTLVDAFQCGAGAPIFLISLKTGGVGLNLTRASYVFHLDPWWNPAVENQASDRVHRIGQKKSVFVTRLLMKHTIEEKMTFLKAKKADLYREVLEGTLPKSGRSGLLSRDDFEFLLG